MSDDDLGYSDDDFIRFDDDRDTADAGGDADAIGFGPASSPSPRMSPRARNDAALIEARLSVFGNELSRALDSTIRPGTSAGLSKSMAFSSAQSGLPAAAPASSTASAAAPPPAAGILRPSTAESGAGMRQSQDLFAALDIANTNAQLKQSYVAYWDAVEEQFKAEQRADEQLRERRKKEAEQKHLQRLKAKMAQQAREASGATQDPRLTKAEAGWDSGFVFDKPAPSASPPASGTFDRPSVVQAKQALANAMAAGGTSSTAFASSTLPAGATPGKSPFGSPPPVRSPPASAFGAATKALPAAPTVVDPSRVKSVVQTHMPSYVLAKLARHRSTSAGAMRAAMASTGAVRGPTRSRVGSAANKRPGVARRPSNLSASPTAADDEAAPFSEEVSPSHSTMRTATSTTSSTGAARPKPRVASAKPARPAASPPSAASSSAPRAASAGHTIKPTNASVLLAAERAAQLHAANNPPDMKQVPLSQWNRMRREVEDLRRKVAALEAENESLRSGAGASQASPPSSSSTSSATHARAASSAVARPAAAAGAAKANLSATTAAPASRPSAAAAAVLKNPALKLNLAALRPDENGNLSSMPMGPAAAAAIVSAVNTLLSPRSKCAVSHCGQNRVGGKPYCSIHAEEQLLQNSSVPFASPRAASAAASSAAFASPTSSATAAAAPSGSLAAAATATGQGLGMAHGFNFALGGGAPTKYSYDYESDDNYGGTESEGSSSGSEGNEDAEDEDGNEHQDGGGSTQRGGGGTARQSTARDSSPQEVYEEDFSTNGGDTQRQGTGTARAPARLDVAPRQNPSLLSSQSQSVAQSPAEAAPSVNRMKSDPTATSANAGAALSAHSNALYSARDRFHIPLRSSVTPRTLTTKPHAIDTNHAPRGSPTAAAAAGGGGGVFDLESLRNSPYANLDTLGGSFEITQSGTFKRGGFALNKHGMTADSAGESERSMASARNRAFQWNEPNSGGGESSRSSGGGLITPTSQQQHRLSASPSPHSGAMHRSGASTPSSELSSLVPTPAGSPTSSSSSSSSSTPFFRPLNVADLYTLGVLGRGSGGVVYKAFYAPSVELLAVKAISIHEKDKRKQLTQELRTLTLAPSPYTIGFRGAYFDEAHIYIALEFMDGGCLDDLREQQGFLGEMELAYAFEQVLRGIKHLHAQKVIHRDIKPHNILYNTRGEFKVTDFGIISDLKDRTEQAQMAEAKTFVGTLLYMSPERIGGASYSYSCDIWSMALSLLTCRVGHFAIAHDSHWELVNAIKAGPAILDAYSSDQVSDTLRDLLSHCLRTNPAERPSAAECLRHPFFSHFRINGAAHPIPLPPNFPPPRPSPSSSPSADAGGSGDPARAEREERRARKAAEVDARNERHMLEQVCKLMVHKGMTSRPPTASPNAADSSSSGGGSVAPSPRTAPLRAPIDPRLCERICDRLATLLKVSKSAVRVVLEQTHSQFVGLA